MLTAFLSPTADSMTFQLLPASVQQQVHVYCSTGGHAGKYMVVTGENKVIAGSKSSGDSVFLRQTVAGNTTTITLSHPASDPMYYLSFDKDTREAQLELELSERSKLEVVDPNFRQGEKQDSEGLVNELDLSEGAPAQKEAESKVA